MQAQRREVLGCLKSGLSPAVTHRIGEWLTVNECDSHWWSRDVCARVCVEKLLPGSTCQLSQNHFCRLVSQRSGKTSRKRKGKQQDLESRRVLSSSMFRCKSTRIFLKSGMQMHWAINIFSSLVMPYSYSDIEKGNLQQQTPMLDHWLQMQAVTARITCGITMSAMALLRVCSAPSSSAFITLLLCCRSYLVQS